MNSKKYDIFLRPLSLDDCTQEYLSWINDPLVQEGLHQEGKNTMESLKDFVIHKISDPQVYFMAICLNENQRHIGNIKMDELDKEKGLVTLGIMIGNRDYWGKGLGRQACELAIDHFFSYSYINAVKLAVFEFNTKAKKLYESMGFKTTRVLEKEIIYKGEQYDKIIMQLSRADYGKVFANHSS